MLPCAKSIGSLWWCWAWGNGVVPMFVNDYTVILVSRIVLGLGLGLYNSLAVAII